MHVLPIQSSAIHIDSQTMILFPFSVTISGVSQESQSFLTTFMELTAASKSPSAPPPHKEILALQ